MKLDKQIGQPYDAHTEYDLAVANISIALLCSVTDGFDFVLGYITAGPLITLTSVIAVMNAQSHRKRGNKSAKEAEIRPDS
jgi:hypothetical protein